MMARDSNAWLKACVIAVAMTLIPVGAQAGAAGGAPEGRVSTSWPATDNHRHIALLPKDGTPVVVDLSSGRSTEIKNADGCFPTDIDSGRVLLACLARTSDDGYVDYYSHRLASTETGRSSRLGSVRPAILSTLGEYWAAGGYDSCGVSPHCTGDMFLNLRTKAVRFFGDGPSPSVRAVDQKRLLSGLTLPHFPIGSAVIVNWDARNLVTDNGRELTLWRPGKKPARLGKAIGYCCEIPSFRTTHFGGGKFVWDLRGNRRFGVVDLSNLKRRTISIERLGDVTPFRGGVVTSTLVEGTTLRDPEFLIRVERFR